MAVAECRRRVLAGASSADNHVRAARRAAHLKPTQVGHVAALARADLGSDRLHRQHSTPLLGQLGARLRVRVEQREVGDDDRNRKCYGEDAGERAQRTNEHADVRLGSHVAVTDRRHRHDRPPQADRDRREVVGRVVLDALGVVDERREDDDADDEEENEQHQFVGARFERVDEDLEAGRVPRQLHTHTHAHTTSSRRHRRNNRNTNKRRIVFPQSSVIRISQHSQECKDPRRHCW